MKNEPELVRACSECIQNQGRLNYLVFVVEFDKQVWNVKVNAQKFHNLAISGLANAHKQFALNGGGKNERH